MWRTPTWIRTGLTMMAAGAFVAVGIPGATQAQTVAPLIEGYSAWSPEAVLNPFSPNAINMYGYVNTPLAYFLEGTGSYEPELAQSWRIVRKPGVASGTVITLHLRSDARWSNGTPITAQDVKMSLELGYVLGYQVAGYIQSIATPNAHTVIVTQNSRPFNLFVQQVLTTWIYPQQEWGKYIPSNVGTLYAASEGTGTAATNAAAKLAKVATTMAAVDIHGYLASGPYDYSRITSDEILLNKNPQWWGARGVKVPSVEILAANGNTEDFAYALSGRTDILSTYAPPTVVEPFLERPDDHILAPQGNYGPGVYFNTSVKPFNLVAVRQAFAYVINRPQATAIANPTPSRSWLTAHGVPRSVRAATPAPYPDGLPPAFYGEWLTSATLHRLNPYKQNWTEAAKLLTSVGMKKVKGVWQYEGKPFTFNITVASGYTNQIAAADVMTTALQKFGIHASVAAVETATFASQVATGQYPVAIRSIGSPDRSPWYDYLSYMSNEGLSINAAGVISRAKTSYNWGPIVSVPGLGTVNVVDLWNNLSQTNDHAEIAKDVNDLALAINTELPVIDLWYTQAYCVLYNTSTYTGFPNPSNPIWSDWISNEPDTVAMLIEKGYIHPTH